MKSEDDPNEIQDILKVEIHRGRRGVLDVEERRRKQRLQRLLLKLAEECDLDGFIETLPALGFEPGSPEHQSCVALWHEKNKYG